MVRGLFRAATRGECTGNFHGGPIPGIASLYGFLMVPDWIARAARWAGKHRAHYLAGVLTGAALALLGVALYTSAGMRAWALTVAALWVLGGFLVRRYGGNAAGVPGGTRASGPKESAAAGGGADSGGEALTNRERVLMALPGGVSDIARRTGVGKGKVSEILSQEVDRGRVRRDGDTFYGKPHAASA